MKTIAGITAEHLALIEEYRMALRLWSESRVLYPEDAPEVTEATRHIETLEELLRKHNN